MVGRIWHRFVWLSHWTTLCTKLFVNGHSMNVCSIESLSPQYRHSLSGLIPNLNNSLFVTIVLWMNLNWNSLSLASLQIYFNDLKNLLQVSLFIDRFLLQHRGPVWSSLWVLTLSSLWKSLDLTLPRFISTVSIRGKVSSWLLKKDLLKSSVCLAMDRRCFGMALTTW